MRQLCTVKLNLMYLFTFPPFHACQAIIFTSLHNLGPSCLSLLHKLSGFYDSPELNISIYQYQGGNKCTGNVGMSILPGHPTFLARV